MRNLQRKLYRLPLVLIVLAIVVIARSQPVLANLPAGDWPRTKPESAGYSAARLEVLRAWLQTEPTTAMMIVANGQVIFEYGDISKVSKIASVRKSVLSMLYGNYVASGKIDLDKTVKQLGLEDKQPFLPLEERATLEQLFTARSGIYLDARTEEATRQQPERGLEYPGTYFFYNNWEFDAAGTAFEKATGKGIYEALESDLARPLGMQDFRRELQRKIPSPGSVHPEYSMYLSTRDLARLGLLMLHGGVWNDKPLVPADWVRSSTGIITPWDEMNPPLLRLRGAPERWGYGFGWWVWDAPLFPGGIHASPFQGAFEARGTGGQYLTVLPARELVLVHKVDLDKRPEVGITQLAWDAIVQMVIASASP